MKAAEPNQPPTVPRVLIISGPSGAGKSTVGRAIAQRTGRRFVDADDYHPPENIERMRAGLPLTEDMREPWLRRLAALIRDWTAPAKADGHEGNTGVVMACSALRRVHREILTDGRPEVRFAFLVVSPERLRERLRTRKGHFMPADLLESQLATLEPPGDDEAAWSVPADGSVAETVEFLLKCLTSSAPVRHPT